jgi:hypothetical protein
MQVNQVDIRPAPDALYTVAGRLLFTETFNHQLRNLIELLFAGWQLTPVSLADRTPDIRIRFFCGDRQPDIPDNLKQFEFAGSGQCYTGDGELYLALQDSLLHLKETKPLSVDVWFAELPGPNDPLTARMTSFAVCAALRRFGLFDLHSAAVVESGSEKGVLIVGPSGSGKSTLALQLSLAGWAYLSDDELLLSLANGLVEARGFRTFFAVCQENARFKYCFEPDVSLGLKRTSQATPGVVLFISLNGEAKSEIRKLTPAQGMMHFIRACPWATYDTSIANANLEVLSTLARQADAFELFAGRDLLQPGYAAEMLSRLN